MNKKVRTAIEVILDSYESKNYVGYKYCSGGSFSKKDGLFKSTYTINKLEDKHGNRVYMVYSFTAPMMGFVDREGAKMIWRILVANGYKSNREAAHEMDNR